MKLGEADLKDSYFQSLPKGNERSISAILVAVLVLFFSSIFLFGMLHVQNVSDLVTNGRERTITEPESEIGDAISPEKRP